MIRLGIARLGGVRIKRGIPIEEDVPDVPVFSWLPPLIGWEIGLLSFLWPAVAGG